MPTLQELADLPYATSPFSQGLTADDFRDRLREHGERVRVWECFSKAPRGAVGPNGETPERNGSLYVEKSLAAGVKALLEQTEREVYDQEFGLIPKGQTRIACMPDEIELARGDRVVCIERLVLDRVGFECKGSFDHLGRKFVAQIQTVIADGELVDVNEYELDAMPDGTGIIRWLIPPPATALVSLYYRPQYVFLDVNDRSAPRGSDAQRLPQRGILTLEGRTRRDKDNG